MLCFFGGGTIYQIKCDDYILYDPRDEQLFVNNPKCKLQVNTVGEASFTIYATHPYYNKLKKMRSVFEILQDGDTIFRGRMTDDTRDFDNAKDVDIEGAMAYFNDSVIRPFIFPDDFALDSAYISAVVSGNVVEFFLTWVIEQHNSQVQDFQKFKLGNVTVADSNNYLSRSSTDYASTWDTLKNKLFDSELGGYLCIRYEEDGNYIDYVQDFELTNIQRVEYGENLLDISSESDATAVCSAIIPLGAKLKDIYEDSEDETRLTVAGLSDGDINEDIVKDGDTIYSKSAVDAYGWIYAPPKSTTWDDVTLAENLRTKSVEYLTNTGIKLSNTIEITAIDLHASDAEIEAFRIYRYIEVSSRPHNHEGRYKLTQLDIDILKPQNTKITLGDTSLSLTDSNAKKVQNLEEKVESINVKTTTNSTDMTEIQYTMTELSTGIASTCEQIILSALESYVESSNYEVFKETVQSQLQLMSDEMLLKFTETTRQIENVNGDLQQKFNTITKYFTFDINGLTIGQSDNPYKVIIDNNRYSMLVNGIEVLWFDAEGKAHIPEVEITRKMNLFGYLIEQDENGNVNCEYVGGES